MRESPTRYRTSFTIPGDSQSWRCSPICTNFSTLNNAKPTSIRSGGKIVHSNVLGARAITLASGACTNTVPDVNATGARAASAPSTTSPIRCCTRASGRWRIGYLPPFCYASPVRRGVLPGKWASISVPGYLCPTPAKVTLL